MPRGKQVQEKNLKKNAKKKVEEEILTDDDDLLSSEEDEELDEELDEEGEEEDDELDEEDDENGALESDEEELEEGDELDEEDGEEDEEDEEEILESEEEKPKNKRGRPTQAKKENTKSQQSTTSKAIQKNEGKQTKNNTKVNSQDKKRTSITIGVVPKEMNMTETIAKEMGSKKTSSNGTDNKITELTMNKENIQNKSDEKQIGIIEKEIQTTSKEIDQLKQNTHYQGGRLKKDPQQPIHNNHTNKPIKHNLIFDTLMQQTETLMDYMAAQSEKIRQLNRKYIFLCSNGAFSKKEVNVFSSAVVYHEETLLRILYLAKKNVFKLEQLWQQKKTIMTDFSAKGAVDTGVGNKWIESLQASRKQIVKFQQTLEFYSKENSS